MLLAEHLRTQPFTLSMSCTFFGYFAHCGALEALLEAGLTPSKVTGSSAGAVVAGLYASGFGTTEMSTLFTELNFSDIFSFRPRLYWGFPLVGMFQQELERLEARILGSHKPKRLEDCPLPVAISVYDTTDSSCRVLTRGRLATAIAASAAVPVLMHGVFDDDTGHRFIDAGVGGDMLGVQGAHPEETVLAVNLFLRAFVPKLPDHLPKAIVVDLYGVPFVTPGSLHSVGPKAKRAAYHAMKRALNSPVPPEHGKARRIEIRPAGAATGTATAQANKMPADMEYSAWSASSPDDAGMNSENEDECVKGSASKQQQRSGASWLQLMWS